MPHSLFPVGRVVATPGALKALGRNETEPTALFRRHQSGDWGDLDTTDRAENVRSVEHGFRILSAYTLPNGTRIWVITEVDGSHLHSPAGRVTD